MNLSKHATLKSNESTTKPPSGILMHTLSMAPWHQWLTHLVALQCTVGYREKQGEANEKEVRSQSQEVSQEVNQVERGSDKQEP